MQKDRKTFPSLCRGTRMEREVASVALRKLNYLHAAKEVKDLMVPPSNHLEKLKGDRRDQYSIRINRRWRLCFEFEDSNALNVEIVDYH